MVLGRTIPGTLVFTSSLLTFTVDDSTEEYSKAAYLVRSDLIPWPLLLHIYTYTSDVMLNCNYKKSNQLHAVETENYTDYLAI